MNSVRLGVAARSAAFTPLQLAVLKARDQVQPVLLSYGRSGLKPALPPGVTATSDRTLAKSDAATGNCWLRTTGICATAALVLGLFATAVGAAEGKPLYQNDFEKAEVGKVPDDMMVLEGAFAVKSEGTNRFLDLPGAPVDDFSVLFGPTESAGVAVTARVFGTNLKRRAPVLAVGLNGVGGYELQLAPAKKALELFKGEERLASVPCTWESGTWTWLRLQVRQVKDGAWKVEGKAWKQGAPEPAGWMIAFDEQTEPPAGRAMVSGHPFSGTPIRFDDLRVSPASGH